MENTAIERGAVIKKELFDAARSGNLEVMKIFAGEAPDLLGAKNERGFTPLIMAAYYDQVEMVKFLVESGVDINDQDDGGNTALMGVAFKNYLEIAKYLIEVGADPNVKNPKGMTALDFAKHFGNDKMAELLESKTN